MIEITSNLLQQVFVRGIVCFQAESQQQTQL